MLSFDNVSFGAPGLLMNTARAAMHFKVLSGDSEQGRIKGGGTDSTSSSTKGSQRVME